MMVYYEALYLDARDVRVPLSDRSGNDVHGGSEDCTDGVNNFPCTELIASLSAALG